jgi:hypothetical protein
MPTIAQRILEISSFPLSMRGRDFFFGVSDPGTARKIFSSGVLPLPKIKSRRKGAPDKNSLVLRTRLDDALSDAMANISSAAILKQHGDFAYIFRVTAGELLDIRPDEKSTGEFVQTLYQIQYKHGKDLDPAGLSYLTQFWSLLDRDEQKAIIYDDEDARILVGRKILNSVPDSTILWMLTQTTYPYDLSNMGPIPFKDCWKVNRRSPIESSNFFDSATKLEKWS